MASLGGLIGVMMDKRTGEEIEAKSEYVHRGPPGEYRICIHDAEYFKQRHQFNQKCLILKKLHGLDRFLGYGNDAQRMKMYGMYAQLIEQTKRELTSISQTDRRNGTLFTNSVKMVMDGAYLDAQYALERYDDLETTPWGSQCPMHGSLMCAAIDIMDPAQKKKHRKQIFFQYLTLEISSMKPPDPDNKLVQPLPYSFFTSLWTGYLMTFAAEQIFEEVRLHSTAQMVSMIATNKAILFTTETLLRSLSVRLHQIKWWSKDHFRVAGMNMMKKAWDDWKSETRRTHTSQATSLIHAMNHSAAMMLIFGPDKWKSGPEHIYRLLIQAVGAEYQLYFRLRSLKRLMEFCFQQEQYLMSKRIQRHIYKLCNGYCLPTYLRTHYRTQKRLLKHKIATMQCGNCGKWNVRVRLRACTGCMIVAYCSSHCHKEHWKRHHKTHCSRHWTDLDNFNELKSLIFS